MKRMKNILAIGAASLMLAAPLAFAAPAGARADIPFEFQLDGRTFDAGAYRFEATQWNGVVALVDSDGRKHLMMTSPLGNPNAVAKPKLVFVQTRSGLSLSEIWTPAAPGGYRISIPPPARGARVEVALSLSNY